MPRSPRHHTAYPTGGCAPQHRVDMARPANSRESLMPGKSEVSTIVTELAVPDECNRSTFPPIPARRDGYPL